MKYFLFLFLQVFYFGLLFLSLFLIEQSISCGNVMGYSTPAVAMSRVLLVQNIDVQEVLRSPIPTSAFNNLFLLTSQLNIAYFIVIILLLSFY